MYGKYCRWCKFYDGDACLYKGIERIECNILHPSSIDFKDAAGFEALVARKLAIHIVAEGHPCPWGKSNLCICEGEGVWLGCEGSRLKWARLTVEAEMD